MHVKTTNDTAQTKDDDDALLTMASGGAALGMILEKIASKDKGASHLSRSTGRK